MFSPLLADPLKKTHSKEPSGFLQKVAKELVLYGNVDIRQADLGFRVFGKVSALLADEGDPVAPGMMLARLDDEPYRDALKEVQGRLERTQAELSSTGSISEAAGALPMRSQTP